MNYKKDFPIFENNPGIVYLDSTATAQKPSLVIDAMKKYLETDYANIHRGAYSLSEKSEKMYENSKKKVAEFIGADSWREIIYSFNSTYCSNLIASSLKRSNFFEKGDKVLVSIVEHHANIVPWLILKEEVGIEIEYIKVKDDYSLDFDDLEEKLKDPKVKVVSITHVSNVTGEIFDLEKVGKIIKENPPAYSIPLIKEDKIFLQKRLFIVDGSQSFPHMKVDVKKIGCDFMFFTGHKFGADSGIGIFWGKSEILSELKPGFSGGGAISWVKQTCFKEAPIPDRFEPGTPNLTGAISVLKALEYIESIGGYEKVEEIEKELGEYFLEKFNKLNGVKLIGGQNINSRVGVFSFIVEGVHSLDIADYLGENGICVRAGQHCAEPFMGELGINHSCRASFFIYTDKNDLDKFFEVLKKAINELK